MITPGEFYFAQAASCARAAADCALPNQRETYLRAEAAWRVLANRESAVRAAREKREAEKVGPENVGALARAVFTDVNRHRPAQPGQSFPDFISAG